MSLPKLKTKPESLLKKDEFYQYCNNNKQHIVSRKVIKPVPTCCHICFTGGSFVLFGLWKSAAESGK